MKILIVCSSNVCRSPYAEFWLKKLTNESDVLTKNIEWIKSAAVFNESKKIFPKTKKCLLMDGFSEEEIDSFTPTFAKKHEELLCDADIIIGMTYSHKKMLPVKYQEKFYSLSEVSYGKYTAIPDPFLTLSFKKYRRTMDIIKDCIVKYAKNLEEKFTNE